MKMPILSAENLNKTYEQGTRLLYAVRDVKLAVEPGEMVAITGTSGAGKSTLIKLCAGLIAPTSGKIHLNGEDITVMKPDNLSELRRQRMGFVFQNYNLIPMLTAQENIAVPALLEGHSPDARVMGELCELLGITDKLGYLPGELSGGEQQRVAIARALINNPSILFADEPTGNLDSENTEIIISLFERLNRNGVTILMVTHDEEIAARCPHRIIMSDGRIIRHEFT